MRALEEDLALSATDLSNFLSCRHRTALDMAVAYGKRKRPHFQDPLLDLLIERGKKHEQSYVESLLKDGLTVVDLTVVADRVGLVERTLEVMRQGPDVIVQGGLLGGMWFGKPDIMRRVPKTSGLGAWSYEIYDTKLARETRAGTILQLGLYSEMLGGAQGVCPELFHVITPDRESPLHTYRVNDYAAYFRLIRDRMEETVKLGDEAIAEANYPEPVEHCEICCWIGECRTRRRHDDHLSLVAGIARLQRRELVSHDVPTLGALAVMPLPLTFKPKRGSADSYTRVHHQARLQLGSRDLKVPLHELRPFEDGAGLCRLPEPSPGDIFLDLEGDPFAVEGGREYLFGIVTIDAEGEPSYRGFWAFTDREERRAFETVIDLMVQRAKDHPGMHIYHYAPYEQSAFKRLMGRYATREQELDSLLRAERFVDLYAVVRQGVIAGVERYSIKNLECFYTFVRSVDLADANRCLHAMEQALEMQCPDLVPTEVRDAVEGYNKDDCISTLRLRDWLETLRAQLQASGTLVPRPEPKEGATMGRGDRCQSVDARVSLRRGERFRCRAIP